MRTLADGHAGETRIAAEAAADAERLSAEAAGVRYSVDADGKRALNEAENLLSSDIVAMRIKLALIEHMDEIIRESVRPIEAIDGIKIVHVEGLSGNGHGNGHADGGPGGGGNLADAAVAAALRYRAQAPIVDSLLGEIGMASGDLNDITRPLREPTAMQPPAATAAVETAAAAVPDATGNGREAPAETPATSAATNGDGDSTGDDTEDDAESRPSAAE